MNLSLTSSAIEKIQALIAAENGDNLRLRITVEGGGCSGFQYKYTFDAIKNDDDLVFGEDGAGIIIDHMSLSLIDGSTFDYVEDLGSAGFIMKNPNATAKCGCGNSFSL